MDSHPVAPIRLVVRPLASSAVAWARQTDPRPVASRPKSPGHIGLVHGGRGRAGADEALRGDHEAYWSGYLDDLAELLRDAAGS